MRVIQCYECCHWKGDKAIVLKVKGHYPSSMDLYDGWPEFGECNRESEWAYIEIHGNGTHTLEVPANFGCPYGELI